MWCVPCHTFRDQAWVSQLEKQSDLLMRIPSYFCHYVVSWVGAWLESCALLVKSCVMSRRSIFSSGTNCFYAFLLPFLNILIIRNFQIFLHNDAFEVVWLAPEMLNPQLNISESKILKENCFGKTNNGCLVHSMCPFSPFFWLQHVFIELDLHANHIWQNTHFPVLPFSGVWKGTGEG